MTSDVDKAVEPSADDLRRVGLVEKLLETENKAISDFAKHVVTVSFTAIGVVLTLKEKWLGAAPPGAAKSALGVAIVLYLAAGALASLAAGAFEHKVSLSDFGEVDAELRRVARKRHRLVSAAFALSLLATALVAWIALAA
jgi:hypothetical protein